MKRLETPNWQKRSAPRRRLWAYVLCAFLLVPLGVGVYFLSGALFGGDGIEASGSVITVRAGGNLQAAIDRAKGGDTIVLQAGATYVGNFVLPNRPGAEYVTITTSELAKLPPDGQRVGPQHASLMPKILSGGAGKPAIATAAGAHHYRFVGIEFAPAGADYVYNLISFGSESPNLAEVPHDFEIDRCFVHPNPKGKTRRGVALNGASIVVKNSHLAGFAYASEETQAIAGWTGPGPFKILNNFLEAGAENVMFGGSDPSIKGLVPSDIEIRGNYMTKAPEWRGKVSIKCTLELKNARKVVISGNVIENSWDEMAIRLTVRNQDGTAPWSTIEDVTLENNVIRNSGGGVNLLGRDDVHPSTVAKRIRIQNNVFEGIDAQAYGGDAIFIKVSGGEEFSVVGNTVFHGGNLLTAHGEPSARFVFRGNIVSTNNYGITADGMIGKTVIAKFLPGSVFADNVIVNGKSVPKSDIYVPPGNFYAENFDAVGFVDWKKGNYRLAPTSKYKGKAGADIDKIAPVSR